MSWDSDALLQKAKLYIARAQEEDREGPLFPLWSSLALELLARAAIAKVHPVLVADPREGDNLLYAFGMATAGKSAPMKTILRRCQKIIPGFTEEYAAFADAIVDRRNEELHSGALAFDNWPTSFWLGQYFQVSGCLANFLGATLEDLFGTDEAAAAGVMIDANERKTTETVRNKIATAKQSMGRLNADERSSREASSMRLATPGRASYEGKCPACGSRCRLGGDRVWESEPRADEGEIVQEYAVLFKALRCGVCDLELSGHGELHAAGFGGQHTYEDHSDPVEFFSIDWRDYDVDWRELAAEELGSDYMND